MVKSIDFINLIPTSAKKGVATSATSNEMIDTENEIEKIARTLATAGEPRLTINWGEPEWIDGAWEIPLQMAVATLDAATLVDLFAEIGRRVAAQGVFNGSTQAGAPDDLAVLTAPEVGALLKVPLARVYEMQRRGEIGCIREGRSVRFRRSQVEEYLRKRSVSAR